MIRKFLCWIGRHEMDITWSAVSGMSKTCKCRHCGKEKYGAMTSDGWVWRDYPTK